MGGENLRGMHCFGMRGVLGAEVCGPNRNSRIDVCGKGLRTQLDSHHIIIRKDQFDKHTFR